MGTTGRGSKLIEYDGSTKRGRGTFYLAAETSLQIRFRICLPNAAEYLFTLLSILPGSIDGNTTWLYPDFWVQGERQMPFTRFMLLIVPHHSAPDYRQQLVSLL